MFLDMVISVLPKIDIEIGRAQQISCLKACKILSTQFFFVVPLIAQLSRNLWHLALPLIFDANTPHQVMPEIQN